MEGKETTHEGDGKCVSREGIEAAFERAKHAFDEVEGKARSFLREHPLTAFAGAVVVGFALGRFLSRRFR